MELMQSSEGERDVDVTRDKLFQINGEPLRFFVGLSSQKNHVELLIKKRGGLVLGKLPDCFKLSGMVLDLDDNGLPSNPEQLIILLDTNAKLSRNSKFTIKPADCFSLSYVESCIEQNKLLNLNGFRIGNKSVVANSQENTKTKKRFHVSEEQHEAALTSEKHLAFMNLATTTTPEPVKRSRQKYNHEHDLILVNFVKEMMLKYPEEKPLGQKLWQRAEELQILGPYRTWQSMRERFKTRLQPYLHQGTISTLAWNQLPIDAEDPISTSFEEENTSTFSESIELGKASVSQGNHADESKRQTYRTEISLAEQRERSSVMLDTNIVSNEFTYGTEENSSRDVLVTSDCRNDESFCRKLLYDKEENKAFDCQQEQLVQKVIRNLSDKYLVPETRVCMALLDANGSVDLALKFLKHRKV
ncbi:hypothetical protein GpartN1_g1651.t1 [Galdieria partita]|uniref:TERF2-interacting telomeric protein 1 Myb domain-containing protein n=1 Tax=Galdieria partita TaxID=83374 RepID=A0A9C7PSW0_9RHOD|nr:hypothetical protein GpartN1_g1651.t1 [Galdieria partita]